MPRYHCTHCDRAFDQPSGPPRCPGCLRQHGLEELGETQRPGRDRSAGSRRLKRALGLVSASLIVAGAIAVALLKLAPRGDSEGRELRPLEGRAIRDVLTRAGVRQADAEQLARFAGGPALARFSRGTSASEPTDRARQVARQIAGKLESVTVELVDLRSGEEPRDAEAMAHALATGRVARALSYELAITLLGALRAAGVTALLAEGFEQNAPVRAADPSGVLGRYVVAVYGTVQELARAPALVLDPARAAKLPTWAGGGGDVAMTSRIVKARPLDDVSAAGRLLGLRALHQIDVAPRSPERAYELAGWALEVSAPSAVLRAGRALVLAKAGGLDDAIAEARRAVRLRADPARRTVLAGLLLAQQKSDQAELELQQAIKQDASFWPAQRSLAAQRWMEGDRSGGDTHLKAARKIAPEEPSVVALVASKKLAEGDAEEALALLRKLAQEEPSEETLLQLYVALLQSGRADEAEGTRERLLAAAADRERIQQLLERIAESMTPARGEEGEGTPRAPAEGGFKLPDVSLR